MIRGCLAWQADGLSPPESVRAATERYLAGEDTFGRWRDECTTPDPNAWQSSAELWASWKRWAEKAGEYVGTHKRLSQTLEERGFTPAREGTKANRRGYRGFRLICQEYIEDHSVRT